MRGRASVAAKLDPEDSVELPHGVTVGVGRRNLRCARSEPPRCSRRVLDLTYDERTGLVAAVPAEGSKHPCFVVATTGQFTRLDEEALLQDEDAVMLWSEGPVLVVRVRGGRTVSYGRKREGVQLLECCYGRQCKRRTDERHAAAYKHSEPAAEPPPEKGGLDGDNA